MQEPDHKIKRHVVPLSNKEKPYWDTHPVHGWLASGLKDLNGVEIFEGDIVKDIDDQLNVVKFHDGCFWLSNPKEYYLLRGSLVVVVGHIADVAEQS